MRLAIENLLFGRLLVLSPLPSSSKYIVGVKATARLFIAIISNQKPTAHFMSMAKMMVRSEILDLQLRHQVLSISEKTQDQLHRSQVTI
jgi:hypothetical protein